MRLSFSSEDVKAGCPEGTVLMHDSESSLVNNLAAAEWSAQNGSGSPSPRDSLSLRLATARRKRATKAPGKALTSGESTDTAIDLSLDAPGGRSVSNGQSTVSSGGMFMGFSGMVQSSIEESSTHPLMGTLMLRVVAESHYDRQSLGPI